MGGCILYHFLFGSAMQHCTARMHACSLAGQRKRKPSQWCMHDSRKQACQRANLSRQCSEVPARVSGVHCEVGNRAWMGRATPAAREVMRLLQQTRCTAALYPAACADCVLMDTFVRLEDYGYLGPKLQVISVLWLIGTRLIP